MASMHTRGTVVFEGELWKRGASYRVYRKRYCVLFSTHQLVYFKTKYDFADKGCPQGCFSVSESLCAQEDGTFFGREHEFLVYTSDRIWYLAAPSVRKQAEWIRHINAMSSIDVGEHTKLSDMAHVRHSGDRSSKSARLVIMLRGPWIFMFKPRKPDVIFKQYRISTTSMCTEATSSDRRQIRLSLGASGVLRAEFSTPERCQDWISAVTKTVRLAAMPKRPLQTVPVAAAGAPKPRPGSNIDPGPSAAVPLPESCAREPTAACGTSPCFAAPQGPELRPLAGPDSTSVPQAGWTPPADPCPGVPRGAHGPEQASVPAGLAHELEYMVDSSDMLALPEIAELFRTLYPKAGPLEAYVDALEEQYTAPLLGEERLVSQLHQLEGQLPRGPDGAALAPDAYRIPQDTPGE